MFDVFKEIMFDVFKKLEVHKAKKNLWKKNQDNGDHVHHHVHERIMLMKFIGLNNSWSMILTESGSLVWCCIPWP